jgi:predicted Zn-dependent peptidase
MEMTTGKEIEKEKDVVLDEINSYLDNPSELIFDDFEELVFKDLPIGRNILGSPSSVKNFTQEKIRAFMKANYDPGKMVFCSVGNIPDEKILRYFRKYFSVPVAGGKVKQKETEWKYKPSFLEKNRDTYQNHCIIGNLAYDLKDSRRVGMFLLNNILGGPGLNSRLNLSLREKNGLAYNIESNYNPYTGTGIFMIYFGTDAKLLKKSLDITMSELKKLRTEKLGAIQMSKARNQMKGYLARGYENYESLMLSLGKNLLVFGRMETFGETCKKIDAVTPSDLMEIANDIFEPSMMSTLIYK